MRNKLLVTWVAPSVLDLPKLGWLEELGRLQKINNVVITSLTGSDISLDDVASALCEPCDVFVWSGHGAPGGLLLPDHTLVKTRWLAAQVSRGCSPQVVILAACGSQGRDDDLRSLTETICRVGVNAIGFPTKAEDIAAGRFTVEYVRALAANSSVVQAFDVALESIQDEVTASGVFLTPGIRDLPFFIEEQLQEIFAMLQHIETHLDIPTKRDNETPLSGPVNTEGRIQSLGHRTSGHVRGITKQS